LIFFSSLSMVCQAWFGAVVFLLSDRDAVPQREFGLVDTCMRTSLGTYM